MDKKTCAAESCNALVIKHDMCSRHRPRAAVRKPYVRTKEARARSRERERRRSAAAGVAAGWGAVVDGCELGNFP
jgi:hypothetical protein